MDLVEHGIDYGQAPEPRLVEALRITVQRERAHDLMREIAPLIAVHYREIASDQDIPLEPDMALYCTIEDSGALRCYTVRRESVLVGYAVFILLANPHHASSKQAIQDVLYVHPEHRRSNAGRSLIRFSEDQLRAEGVQLVSHHVKVKHPTLGFLLQRMGYELREYQFVKRLDLPEKRQQRVMVPRKTPRANDIEVDDVETA